MTTGHIFMAISLDGFVARADSGLDWLMKQPTEGEDHGYASFMESVDGLVMGSGSFKTVLAFDPWPYEKPVIVLSRTLTPKDIPEGLRGKVTLSNLAPRPLMASLADIGWTRAYIDGGKIIQSYLREGLIADMTVTVVPILIGQGKRMFGTLDADVDLRLLSSQSFASGLVTSKYEVIASAS
jgi:dihydrofolate reductase